MLAVAVARRPAEDRDHHLRPEPPHDPHDVLEKAVARPLLQRLLEPFRVAVVVRPGEELARPVGPPRRQELAGPQDAKLLPEFRAQEVLPALPTGERQVGGLRSLPEGEEREEAGVLVVGVGADDQHPLGRTQPGQLARERSRATRGGRGDLGVEGSGREKQRGRDERRGQGACAGHLRGAAPSGTSSSERRSAGCVRQK